MSAEATGACWKFSPFKGDQLLVHLAIADVVNDMHGNRFWMLRDNLAEKARTSRASVDRALSFLLKNGWLEVLTPGRGRGNATEYQYYLEGENASEGRALEEGSDEENASSGSKSASSAHCEPLPIPRDPKTRANASRSAAAKKPFQDDFERAWAHYPRKIAKQAAYRAYAATRRRGVEPKLLHKAPQIFAQVMVAEGRADDKILHGATFYGRDERWRDYLDWGLVAQAKATGATGAKPADPTTRPLPAVIDRCGKCGRLSIDCSCDPEAK